MKYIKLPCVAVTAAFLLTACSYGLDTQQTSDVTESIESSQVISSSQAVSSSQPLESSSEEISQPSEPESSSKPMTSSKEESAMPSNQSDWRLILVNRENPLPKGFTVELEETIGTYRFDKRAADALRDFMKAAKKDGIALAVISTFRKQSTQERLYSEKVAEYVNAGYTQADAKVEASRWVAIPGTSEHQSGLAVDVVSADWYSKHDDLYESFEDTTEFEWLIQHCVEYGFVLRYPKDKQDITGINYEPWHYRYVGVEHARYMTEHNLCLEEYVAELAKG